MAPAEKGSAVARCGYLNLSVPLQGLFVGYLAEGPLAGFGTALNEYIGVASPERK
jgi:hypothetical protein